MQKVMDIQKRQEEGELEREKQRVLEQYNTIKRMEDNEIKSFLNDQYQGSMNAATKIKQEKVAIERFEDEQRMKGLVLDSNEAKMRLEQEKKEYMDG